jgi:creatinine deaminase
MRAEHIEHGVDLAYQQARKSYDEGGLPIGAVLMTEEGEVVARGHNMRVQEGSPILHGEMSCIRAAGRRTDWHMLTLFTTLSPCPMCSGTAVLHKVRRVVIAESENFQGREDWLLQAGIEVVKLRDARCIELMGRFIAEKPQLWNEDIAVVEE